MDPFTLFIILFVLTIGLSYAGGLFNAPEQPEAAEQGEGTQNRLWNPITTQQEGIARSRNYGKNLHHGNIISKWTDVVDNREVQYLLIDHGDGPTKGVSVVGGEPQIWINDQPLSNFTAVEYQERLGTMNQTCMTGFENPKNDYKINTELKFGAGPILFTTPNDSFDDIIYVIMFPNGLSYQHKSGGFAALGVRIKVRIREVGGAWTGIYDDTISSYSNSPLFYKFTVSDYYAISRGTQYELEFSKLSGDSVSRVMSDVYIRSVQEVIETEFTHPGRALVGLRAVSSSHLSGKIDVKVVREDRIISTFDVSGNATLEYSNNRAWVAYDIATLPAIDGDGGGTPYAIDRHDGIDPQYLDLDFFYNWSVFCAEEINDGNGGTEPRCACNLIVDEIKNVTTLVRDIGVVGRATLYWKDQQLTGWIDKAVGERIDLVTMDSIMHKSWKNAWAIAEELAGATEIFYKDEKQGYERTKADAPGTDADRFRNIVSLEGIGLTTRGTAIHYAHYLLERNRLIRNKNSFRTHKEGFRYKLGDVIRLQCRISNWGKAFRVVSNTADTITVDRDASTEVSIGDTLFIRTYDTALKVVVTDTYEVTSVVAKVITVERNWDVTPIKGDIVATGDIKSRRIIKLTPTVDNYFNVEVETYDADLFDADDLDPDNPNANYVWAGAVTQLSDILTRQEIIDYVEPKTPMLADTEIPVPSNLSWDDDTPGGGFIAWSKTDADDDIEIAYRGTAYSITPGNTDKEFVYWNSGSPNVFGATNLAATAFAPGNWMIRINEGGEALPAYGQWIIKTPVIEDEAVSTDGYTYTEGKLPLIYGTFYNLVWVVFAATGRSVRLQCSSIFEATNADNTVPIQVKRTGGVGGTVYFIQSRESLTLPQDSVINAAFDVIDEPVAGIEYTYWLQARKGLDVGNIDAMNRTFSVTELKK
ncbi:hypothetical protein LCGC14_1568180 [marine sediment metagenome]|uniref:Uncharacterized protein n=1 Tax=marine sediment metagenome TaxID=412755 RepID=A0A0F9L1L6_9ZZZZ